MQLYESQPRTSTLSLIPAGHETIDAGTSSQLSPTAIQEAVHI